MRRKFCPRCERRLLLSAFRKNARKPDGVQSYCKVCQAEYDRQRWAGLPTEHRRRKYQVEKARIDRVRNFLAAFKRYSGCKECGVTEPCVLDFHHNGEKTDSLSNMVKRGFSLEKLIAEIAECDVLCSNCHRLHHCKVSRVED